MNKVSLFIIGSELVRGIIEDRHTKFLSSELSGLGYTVLRSIIVPDDGSISLMLGRCLNDSDAVLITGGLGPTTDDMTRTIVAKEAGVELKINKQAWDTLYARVGERIHGANEQQAKIPEGFEILENPNGTAPGFMGYAKRANGKETLIICMPGPPREMQPMFSNLVRPYLAGRIGKGAEREEYTVYLTAEALLEEVCRKCAVEGVEYGTRFQDYKISLYLSGADRERRNLMRDRLFAELGEGIICEGNREAVDTLCELLSKNGLTVATAESCTSGWMAKLLTDKPGSSAWFKGGAAVYSEEAKASLCGVSDEILKNNGVYSRECAAAMAEGIRTRLNADLGISITGIAGPDGGTADNPAGTVYFGLSSAVRPTATVKLNFNLPSRNFIRKRATVAALILAAMYLDGRDLLDSAPAWNYI